MKNQYIGDIGDYGKYSMLRVFANAGVKVGVNWYLTLNDNSNDGKFTEYLKNSDDYRDYDPYLFDILKKIAPKKRKSVTDIQESGVISEAIFYSELLCPVGNPSERRAQRSEWFAGSVAALKDASFIFMDPDND